MTTLTDDWLKHNDDFIEGFEIPEGRNDRCPCGCGKKWKKIMNDEQLLEEHFNNFKKEVK